MKNMKIEQKNQSDRIVRIIGYTFFTALLIWVAFSMQAQGQAMKEGHHAKLSEHHTKIMKTAVMMKEGPGTTKIEAQKQVKEIGKHLMEAKKQCKMMEKAMPGHKAEHDAIKKNHTEATVHLKALQEETNKPKVDAEKVKDHVTKLHSAIEKAEEANKKIMGTHKI